MASSTGQQRWMADSGILRKHKPIGDDESQELLVFGYSCKLFRDDERAKMIDQGKHLIPWMGDNSLKIDRYDGRGALGDLTIHEPLPGGYDQRTLLTEEEYKVEQICDEERYRSLYNAEIEDALYHEEELKRLHQALDGDKGYSQVGFNYDEQSKSKEDSQSPRQSEDSQEDDQAFIPDPELEIPELMVVPESMKLHAIITKTAFFISQQGSQMEILIKTKQANNPQFEFLSVDGELHPYYKHILQAIKSGKYHPEKQEPEKETKDVVESESDDDGDDTYLHPSLASSLAKIEAAPNIPSISYKPSADCAYSMLVNKITGKPPSSNNQPQPQHQPSVLQPHSQMSENISSQMPSAYYHPMQNYPQYPVTQQQYSHGPVIYPANGNQPSLNYPQTSSSIPKQEAPVTQTPQKEVVSLVPYGPTPPKPLNRPSFIVPPAEVQIIIDKMASYVAKNGRDFESIVKSKGDPRFNFLELSHQYHGYYAHKLTIYEGAINPKVLTEEELLQKQELQEEKLKKLEELQRKQQRMEEVQKRVKMIQAKKKEENTSQDPKQIMPVSFSIKKPKDGESNIVEKLNAFPAEESEDEANNENVTDNYIKADSSENGSIIPPRANFYQTKQDSDQACTGQKHEFLDNIVDLTDDTNDEQVNENYISLDDDLEEKLMAMKEKLVASANCREKQLQLERRRKAAMFLSQIQVYNKPKISSPQTPVGPYKNNLVKHRRHSPIPEIIQIDDVKSSPKSSSRSRRDDIEYERKKSKKRSRSRSRSSSYSDKYKSHKKHKKKKSHRRDEHESSRSSYRSHKSKKSKKSSRYRSRSPSPYYQKSVSSRHRRDESTSSDSSSDSS